MYPYHATFNIKMSAKANKIELERKTATVE